MGEVEVSLRTHSSWSQLPTSCCFVCMTAFITSLLDAISWSLAIWCLLIGIDDHRIYRPLLVLHFLPQRESMAHCIVPQRSPAGLITLHQPVTRPLPKAALVNRDQLQHSCRKPKSLGDSMDNDRSLVAIRICIRGERRECSFRCTTSKSRFLFQMLPNRWYSSRNQ